MKPTTSEAQLKAARKYQDGLARIVLWYPKADKTKLAKSLKAKGKSYKDVFELGLKHLGLSS